MHPAKLIITPQGYCNQRYNHGNFWRLVAVFIILLCALVSVSEQKLSFAWTEYATYDLNVLVNNTLTPTPPGQVAVPIKAYSKMEYPIYSTVIRPIARNYMVCNFV